jgi:hypothetical protein
MLLPSNHVQVYDNVKWLDNVPANRDSNPDKRRPDTTGLTQQKPKRANLAAPLPGEKSYMTLKSMISSALFASVRNLQRRHQSYLLGSQHQLPLSQTMNPSLPLHEMMRYLQKRLK